MISPELNRHWNDKLKEKYALAPRDWFRQGLVTDKIYDHQTDHWAEVVGEFMLEVLADMVRNPGPEELRNEKCFQMNGTGLFRDGRKWIPTANSHGLAGVFCEAATWPYRHAKKWLLQMGISRSNYVRLVEIQGHEGEIDPDAILIIDSGFKGILNQAVMQAQGRVEGAHMRQSKVPVVIVVIHAEQEHNKEHVLWGDRIDKDLKRLLPQNFPYQNRGVEWGDHNPYPFDDVLAPISEGLGRQVQVMRHKQFFYFHQLWEIKSLVSC